MRLLPASNLSTVAILLVLGFELAGSLLCSFVCALFGRRRERTARTPELRGGLPVLPLPVRYAPDARKAA